MSKTASLRRGGTISAAVGGAMAASMTSSRGGGDTANSLALIERLEAANEKTAAGIDEFSRLFGQDDIRLLVDLLKLSVSGRCSGGGGAGRIVVQTMLLPGPDKHFYGRIRQKPRPFS